MTDSSQMDTKSILLKTVKQFDPSVENGYDAWNCWINHFEMSMASLQIKESKAKITWLFFLGGKKLQVLDEFITRQRNREKSSAKRDESNDEYSFCKTRFTSYFSERRYIEKFRQIVQVDGENFEKFVTRLRSGSKLCQFNNDPEEEIRRQISTGAKRLDVRQKAFSGSCTMRELVEFAKNIELDEVKNSKLKVEMQPPQPSTSKVPTYVKKHRPIFCIRCGGLSHKNIRFCRGYNGICEYCGNKGHTKKCCMHRVLESEHIKETSARLQM